VFEGNEAVTADKITGKRKVEYPPFLEKNASTSFMPRWNETTHQGFPGIWYMIEGPSGLRECGGANLSDSVCREPTLGVYKWNRHWVVKLGGKWVLCTGRTKPITCAPPNEVVKLLGATVAE
jgi:hypothetical protein